MYIQMIDTRSREILEIILKSDNPVACKDIGRILHISARMVRYRLNSINSWLKARNVDLILKTKQGALITISDDLRGKLISEINEPVTDYSVLLPNERIYIIIITLLTSSQPLAVKQIALKCVFRCMSTSDSD